MDTKIYVIFSDGQSKKQDLPRFFANFSRARLFLKLFIIFSNMYFTPCYFSFSGDIKGLDSLEFISYDFDLLINFFNDNNILTLLSSKVKAKFRVGFDSVDSKLNDLIFSKKIKKFNDFEVEFVKYLKLIK